MPRRFLVSVPVANPAAGAAATYVVGGSWRERIECAVFTLTTDAVAGNRTAAVLILDPDGNTVYCGSTGGTQAASGTRQYGASAAGVSSATSSVRQFSIPLPAMWLDPGWQVQFIAQGIDPGDTITGVRLAIARVENVESMFEPGFPAGDYIERGRA